MKVTLEQLQNSPEGKIHVNFCQIIQEVNPNKEVKATLDVEEKGACIEVYGTLNADVELDCDRCLKKFNYRMIVDIDEVFTTVDAFDYSHSEIELKNDNFVVELGSEGEIDITDLIYQTVLLNLPNKKICDENCQGLEAFQELQANRIDPRLAVFKNISEDLSKKEGK